MGKIPERVENHDQGWTVDGIASNLRSVYRRIKWMESPSAFSHHKTTGRIGLSPSFIAVFPESTATLERRALYSFFRLNQQRRLLRLAVPRKNNGNAWLFAGQEGRQLLESRLLISSQPADFCLPPSRRRLLLCRPAPLAGR